MMEMEVPVMNVSQQDMELIDILWRQDIDLGARREVFDYSHRQKEHELQRQRELEEEKRLQLLREQEKALLEQLQLDEETGEYIPRPPPSTPLQSAATPLEVTQNANFTGEDGDGMSFDECLQLLAETFPLVEATEDTPVGVDTTVPAPSNSHIMMSPEQPALPQTPLSPDPLVPQRTSLDLEQAWMELLSLPELQCLNMQMEDTLETTAYPVTNSPEVQDANYSFYPLPNLTDVGPNNVDVCPPEMLHALDTFPNVAPPDSLNQMTAKALQLNTSFSADNFCDMFYPNPILSTKESTDNPHCLEGNGSSTLSEVPNKPAFQPMDIHSLSPGDTFERCKQEVMAELPDSDSGISLNTSPNASSPEKSVSGDGSFGFSDSDMDEPDLNPGSEESDYSEMFCLNFQPDDLQPAASLLAPVGQQQQQQEKKLKQPRTEPAEETGHNKAPFTKDKQRKTYEVRLSRDEQRAKALQIPFTVDMIINLPVDDFNEMLSKHQLNEAQLALVRDIRRRGKNKVAAQNCRKRKMENIVELEYDLDSLKEQKERLLREKSQNDSNLREMKLQLNSLYLEVFSMLRDEEGNSYSPSDYSLQQTSDGSVFLVPRTKKTPVKNKNKHLSL
ncbi:nuclear factor erythroid 2-related factor 2a isoform X2 [Myripristis murdjan]|uniref:nuclear factor erythroid 2-related factor 2a isoform X2 n=1 Tax=Myripristis murdjan TaxID=586833 RepID=UPI001176111B|nr:nuclear factor erythroid 2-related factor 2 isoform X2 [Myripristis murdjan]